MPSDVSRVTQDVFRVRKPLLRRRLRQALVITSIALFGLSSGAGPAWAHGGSASEEGYVLVQQALGHLAHGITHESMDLAMEKIDAALVVKDQDGVAVAEVEKAKLALAAGHIAQTRALLQGSIKEAMSKLKPATGEETGTTMVVPALPGRKALTGGDWGMLAAALVLVLAGIGLAFRFRPQDTVGELRRRLGASGTVVGHDAGDPPVVEAKL